MRILCASTQGAGHFAPLASLARACVRRGHDVLAAGPPSLAGQVAAAGLEYWPFDAPDPDELGAVWSRVPSLSPDEQNEVVIGEVFARLDAQASLPRLSAACEEWEPDVVLRETSEFGSLLAAELHDIPHVRAATSLSLAEDRALEIAANVLDELRARVGLPADPGARALRQSPYATFFPRTLEDPQHPGQPLTLRYRDPAWDAPAAQLPDWWAGDGRPLVYVTFGSVAGGIDAAARIFAVALEAVSAAPVRVLLTVGRDFDIAALGPLPANVHVESWVPQADVLGRADAVVCHGGSGSVLGALAAGLPLVVVPLFADQPANAGRVAAVGAGIVAAPQPGPIRAALDRILAEPSFRSAARDSASEMRAHDPGEALADVLAELAGTGNA